MNQQLLEQIKFDERGLIPAIVQEAFTGRVLMLAYMNRESVQKTFETGRCWFYSRSRLQLWEKGATSGNYQFVESLHPDCDSDTLLIKVRSAGPACHTGAQSCFENEAPGENPPPVVLFKSIAALAEIVRQRHAARPAGSYTAQLFDAGLKKIAQKVGEEGLEVALAAVGEDDGRLAEEAADLIYHLLVLLEARGLSPDRVGEVLQQRAR